MSKDPVFASWGEVASAPKPGYLVVFKDVLWETHQVKLVGRGTVKSKQNVINKHRLPKHVAVVAAVSKDGSIEIAHQGVPDVNAVPEKLRVPIKQLMGGEVRYYRPVPMPAGKKTSSPNNAAKAAAAGPNG